VLRVSAITTVWDVCGMLVCLVDRNWTVGFVGLQIKFLKTKEGCAMIQMGDGLAVERCVQNLNNVALMGSKLQLGWVATYSQQKFVHGMNKSLSWS
jgi:hypothetical protein